jgi:CubicO group peptidase (beta-lactamase class C family)
MPDAILGEFAARVREKNLNVLNALIRQGGEITERCDFAAEKPVLLYSVSKTFTSMAIGVAIGEAFFKLTDRVVSFFPEITDKSENLELMTVRDLLCMGTGHAECPVTKAGWFGGRTDMDIKSLFFSQPVVYRPGAFFMYDNAATYMLSRILTIATGERLDDYIYDRILRRLDIARPLWETCSRGFVQGFSGLHMAATDLSKFGQLVLDRGAWKGGRLIPEDYVAEACKKQIDNGGYNLLQGSPDQRQGYGYQLWMNTYPDSCRMDGAGGHFVVLLPDKYAVITIVSQEWRDMFAILTLVWDCVADRL